MIDARWLQIAALVARLVAGDRGVELAVVDIAIVAGILSAVTAVVSAGVSLVSMRQQADAAEDAAEYEAKLAARNAEQARLDRIASERLERRAARRRRAAIEAAYAKSGVLLEGTPETFLTEQAAVDEQSHLQGTLDAQSRSTAMTHSAAVSQTDARNRASALRSGATAGLFGGLAKVGKGVATQSALWKKYKDDE